MKSSLFTSGLSGLLGGLFLSGGSVGAGYVPPAANAAPVWTSPSSVNVNENIATAFYTCSATDADLDSLVYSIIGGADAAKFAIAGAAVRFVTAPDWEAVGPKSAAGTNVYDLVLGVADGANPAVPRAVTVTVLNVLEVALAGVTVTPVSGLTGDQAAGTVLATIAGRVAGDDLALGAALAAAGAVFNAAKSQIVAGISGIASGSYAYDVDQSHPDAATTARTSGTVTISAAAAALITSVAADGWQASHNGPAPVFTPDTSPAFVALVRRGYDATATLQTNIAENLIINRRVRNVYPNQATDVTVATAFSPANAVALSDPVYPTDVIAGVVNNSVKTSPLPVANWVVPDRLLVANTIGGAVMPVEVTAWHRNGRSGRMVAAVKFVITDGVTTLNVVVAATVVSNRPGDQAAVVVYQLPATDITALAAGLIKVDAFVYPWIGDAASVLATTAGAPLKDFTTRYFRKDVARFNSPPLAYVSAAGVDATGVWSTNAAAAAASPFLTIQGATTAIAAQAGVTGGVVDGCRIRIGAGTFVYDVVATAKAQNIAALIVERDPSVARSAAIVNLSATSRLRIGSGLTAPLTAGRVHYSDVTVSRTAAAQFDATGSGTANSLEIVFDNIDYQAGASSSAILGTSGTITGQMFGVNASSASMLTSLSIGWIRIRGLLADLNGSGTINGSMIVGSKIIRGAGTSSNGSGMIVAFNYVLNHASGIAFVSGAGADAVGVVHFQNAYENTHTTTSTPGFRMSSDAENATNITHLIIGNNTCTGAGGLGRHNLLYDTNVTGAGRLHELFLVVGELAVQLNTKGDKFAANAARTGQMALSHGVGCRGNFAQYATANPSTESQDYPGIGSKIAGVGAPIDPLFTDYKATTPGPVAGAGGGTYTLQAGSPARGINPFSVISHDLAGNARPALADAAGAYA